IHSAAKHFGVMAEPGLPRFSSQHDSKDDTSLGPLRLPVERDKLLLLPFMMDITETNWLDYEDIKVRILDASLKKEAVEALKIPQMKLKLWLDTNDLPIKVAYSREN